MFLLFESSQNSPQKLEKLIRIFFVVITNDCRNLLFESVLSCRNTWFVALNVGHSRLDYSSRLIGIDKRIKWTERMGTNLIEYQVVSRK